MHVLHQRSHGIGSTRSMFCNRCSCIRRPLCRHVSCKGKTPGEHSPTRRKRRRIARIKGRGAVSICVTAPIILPGPTNTWALHLPTLLSCGAPLGHLHGPAWPPAMCPRPARNLRPAWATRGLATWPQCSVASARWSPAQRQLAGWSCLPRQLLR